MRLQLVVRRVKGSQALDWYRQGWQLMRNQPRLIALCWLMYLLSFTPALIHPALSVLVNFLSTFLLAGFYQAIVNGLSGRTVQLDDLWQAFKQPASRLVLLRLAAVSVLCALPAQLAAEPLVAAVKDGQQIELTQLMLFVALQCINAMLFAYAVPVMYFLREGRILPVLTASFMACWRNVSALTVYGLVALVLLASGPLTFLLSYVLVLPLLSVCFFLSFRDIFALTPAPEDGDHSGGDQLTGDNTASDKRGSQDGTFEV